MRARALTAIAGVVVALSAAFAGVVQHPPIDAKVTVNKTMPGAVGYFNPATRVGGTIEAAPGNRLYIVEIAVGESDVAAELAAFPLVGDGGREYVAIAAGGGSDLLFPIDKMALGREMTQVLPTDAVIAVTRHSPMSIVVETTPKATLALLYEIPETATVVALKLPDGSARSLR